MNRKTERPPAEPEQKKRKTPPKETFSVTLEDGSVIDLDSFDWGAKLTQKEKLFIFWYTYPSGTAYHDMTKSSRKAGYSHKTAKSSGYNLRHNPRLEPIIARFDRAVVKTAIEDAYHRILQRKIVRATFDGLSFYKVAEAETDDGKRYTTVSIKKPEELTEEQKLCIDGVEFAGQRSIPVYKLPDRKTEENKIIEIYRELNGEESSDGYEVETTAEIIKGNLQVKTKVIKANAEITELSELKNKSAARVEED